ncbi:MAG TPA: hypothetical protein PLF40_31190, partial [Kofleriaceae bacterium]|nr:hypothetical protein [Kofleriaceae bacterium]
GPVTGCKAAPDKCTGDKPVCDMTTDTCVPCLGSNVEDMSCPAAAPVCSSQACGVCTADAQCSSGVCRADGTCSAVANVISVAPGGAGTTCDKTSPCDLTTGVGKISTSKNVLHLAPGNYPVNAGLTLATDVAVVGRGATLDRIGGTPGPVVSVTAAATLEFLTITGGHGANGVGISTNFGTLTLTAATVRAHTDGGISLTNSGFKLLNNFIVKNGSATSVFGGMLFSGYVAANPTLREFKFNTIVDNQATSGLANGINCSNVTTDIIGSSNIVFDNTVKATAADAKCSYIYSAMGPTAVPGMNNINTRPAFVSGNDYHLSSAAANAGIANPTTANDPAATLATDVDGQARPQGGGNRDLGADEVP